MSAAKVHVSKVGTYHPDPRGSSGSIATGVSRTGGAWTVNDTRGYLDPGPACDECGACECDMVSVENEDGICRHKACAIDAEPDCGTIIEGEPSEECIGLSFAFVCLDGGDSLCEDCAEKAGIEIVPCDCGEQGS